MLRKEFDLIRFSAFWVLGYECAVPLFLPLTWFKMGLFTDFINKEDEDDDRRQKRREKNRAAAQRSRKKQTQRADILHEVRQQGHRPLPPLGSVLPFLFPNNENQHYAINK